MADVLPFAAVRFNTKDKKLNLADLVAPPYDVISPEYQKALYDRSPYNIIRVELGTTQPNDDEYNNRYSRAASILQQWKQDEALITEKKRCFYAYEQEFTVPGVADRIKRRGFFALVRIMDYKSGRIRAHEKTFAAPKADRLKLLRATNFNTSPIFCLYSDPDKEIAKHMKSAFSGPPADTLTDESGTIHRLWVVQKTETINGIRNALKNRNLFIADGHHRYETAMNYRNEQREITGRNDGRQSFDYTLMNLTDFEDEGLVILPTHRVLAREYGSDVDLKEVLDDLGQHFTLEEFSLELDNLDKAVATVNDKLKLKKGVKTRLVMALPSGRAWQLTLNKDADLDDMIDAPDLHKEVKSLDVTILHRYVISRAWIGNPEVELEESDIFYEKSAEGALALLKKRKGCVAFLMNPTTKEQVQTIADLGELMPHKSTYFYPKLLTGLVLRDLSNFFE